MLINRVRKLAGGVANNLITCLLCEGFFLHGEAFGINLLSGVRCGGVPNVRRKSMEKQSGPKSLSVISQVSAVEGCPLSGCLLSGVPLYIHAGPEYCT